MKDIYIGPIALALVFICGFYGEIKQILIGKKIIKSKKHTDEKDLKKMFLRGLICLILQIMILAYFIIKVCICI